MPNWPNHEAKITRKHAQKTIDLYSVSVDGGDFATIQEAVESVPEFSRIVLLDSLYNGDGNRDIEIAGKNISIYSEYGIPAACMIDCGGSADEPHRAFVFGAGITDRTLLTGDRDSQRLRRWEQHG